MIDVRTILNERIKRVWTYFLLAFAFGWGIFTASKDVVAGLAGFVLWISVFMIAIGIEGFIRKD